MSGETPDERQSEIQVVGGLCQTTEELLASETFQRVLALFNKKVGAEYTAAEVAKDYAKASEVGKFWERVRVSGQVASIVDVQNLVQKSLDQVRTKFDLERVLSTREIMERFLSLDVDIESIHQGWREFYASMPRHRRGLVQAGQLGQREQYHLPMPSITEGEMQAFETAYRNKQVDAIMVDDARLTGEELFDMYHRMAGQPKIRTALPVDLSQLEDPSNEMPTGSQISVINSDIQEARKLVKSPKRGVRLVAYQRDAQQKVGTGKDGAYSFIDGLSGQPHEGVMELTTYLNILAKHTSTRNFSSLSDFQQWDFIESGKTIGSTNVSTLLNNVYPNGDVLVASGKGNSVTFRRTRPDTRTFAAFARKTIQSDIR